MSTPKSLEDLRAIALNMEHLRETRSLAIDCIVSMIKTEQIENHARVLREIREELKSPAVQA